MNTIQSLSVIDKKLEPDDILVVFQTRNQDERRCTLTLLLEFIKEEIETSKELASQYSSPASGATTQVTDSGASTHLILTPASTLATLTLKLPLVTNLADKQRVLVTSSQSVTALTVDLNGASGNGIPSTIAAGGFFSLKYDAVMSAWNRIG